MHVTRCWLLCLCIQWVPEITHHCPKTPFLLVGTQIDLRDDPSTIEKLAKNKQKPITPETAEKLARDLKAVKYVECSALTQVIHTQTHTLLGIRMVHIIMARVKKVEERGTCPYLPPGLCMLWLMSFLLHAGLVSSDHSMLWTQWSQIIRCFHVA